MNCNTHQMVISLLSRDGVVSVFSEAPFNKQIKNANLYLFIDYIKVSAGMFSLSLFLP